MLTSNAKSLVFRYGLPQKSHLPEADLGASIAGRRVGVRIERAFPPTPPVGLPPGGGFAEDEEPEASSFRSGAESAQPIRSTARSATSLSADRRPVN